jgi:hypothetical protein
MRHKRYKRIYESLEDIVYQDIQLMIDANPFLKGKVKADESTIFEAGDFILLLGDLSHITDAHVDETIPGSKFSKGVDLKEAIINLVSENEPTEMTKGFGPNQTVVSNPSEAQNFKWLGVDCGIDVGVENVHQLDPNSPEFESMNIYTYRDTRGTEFKIKVIQGEGEPTTYLSFIGTKIGEIGGKIVLSVITSFPGENGLNIPNRNDFIKNGLYFTTTNPEVIEKSTGSLTESRKFARLKSFRNFDY